MKASLHAPHPVRVTADSTSPRKPGEESGAPAHHAVFDTPQKNGSGPLTMPDTFLRQA